MGILPELPALLHGQVAAYPAGGGVLLAELGILLLEALQFLHQHIILVVAHIRRAIHVVAPVRLPEQTAEFLYPVLNSVHIHNPANLQIIANICNHQALVLSVAAFRAGAAHPRRQILREMPPPGASAPAFAATVKPARAHPMQTSKARRVLQRAMERVPGDVLRVRAKDRLLRASILDFRGSI